MDCVNEGNLFWISLMDTFQHTLILLPFYSALVHTCPSHLPTFPFWPGASWISDHLNKLHATICDVFSSPSTCSCSLECVDSTVEMISHLAQVILWLGYFLCSDLLFNFCINPHRISSLWFMSVFSGPILHFLTQVGNLRPTCNV